MGAWKNENIKKDFREEKNEGKEKNLENLRQINRESLCWNKNKKKKKIVIGESNKKQWKWVKFNKTEGKKLLMEKAVLASR